uniref:Uncharacterized protein n=1 Tax=Macrostomum lignano TaxID=282301 RepID=A0A1I8JLT8_9PLAT
MELSHPREAAGGQFAAVPLNLAGQPGAHSGSTLSLAGGRSPLAKRGRKVLPGCASARRARSRTLFCIRLDSEDSDKRNGGQSCLRTGLPPTVYTCATTRPFDRSASLSVRQRTRARVYVLQNTGWVFAGAQKNAGPARCHRGYCPRDLIGRPGLAGFCPSVLQLTMLSGLANLASVFNEKMMVTQPQRFAVQHAANLQHLRHWPGDAVGSRFWGVARMQELSREKSSLLYNLIENSQGFYYCPVDKSLPLSHEHCVSAFPAAKLWRSVCRRGRQQGLTNLEGHRVDWRSPASLYNAVTIADTRTLASFMRDFAKTSRSD